MASNSVQSTGGQLKFLEASRIGALSIPRIGNLINSGEEMAITHEHEDSDNDISQIVLLAMDIGPKNEALMDAWLKNKTYSLVAPTIEKFIEIMEMCESPIEKTFICALDSIGSQYAEDCDYIISDYRPSLRSSCRYLIEPQYKIGNYRIDFRVTYEEYDMDGIRSVSILIECDGHDFHERTKEQAKKDRAKDRFLQDSGHSILRFTGSEIHKDAVGCAHEAMDFLIKKFRRGRSLT